MSALTSRLAKRRMARTGKIRRRALEHLEHAIREAGPALSLEWVSRDPDLAYFWEGTGDPTWRRITRGRARIPGASVHKAGELRELLADDELERRPAHVPPRPWGDPARRVRRWRRNTGLIVFATVVALVALEPDGLRESAIFVAAAGVPLAVAGRRLFIASFEQRLDTGRTRFWSRRRSRA